jgi:hypothetical protein
MSAFNTVETDYTLTCADGLGNFIVNANLQVNGNITYSGTSTITAPFVLVAANNTGVVTEMGLLAQTGANAYSAIRFNSVVNAWQLSPSVNAVGNAVVPYANIATINDITYGNANVAAYLPTYTGNVGANNVIATQVIANTANILGNTVTVGVLTDNYYYANGAPVSFSGTYNDANVAAYLPTYTGNLDSLTGNVVTTANVAANYYLGNGSQLTGMYGNADVANYLPTYTGNVAAGNVISDNYLYANGTPISSASLVTGDQQIVPDGASLVYTLNQNVTNENNILVALNGVIQYPVTSYVASGNSLIFATPPLASDLIDVRFLGQGPSPYGNANVAAYLTTNTGNIQANNVSIISLFQSPLRTVTSTDPGNPGQICWDGNYIYVCVGTNTWSRVQLTAGPF